MNNLIRYVHGSEDSTDLDVYYVLGTLPSFAECQSFCAADETENRNIITIEDGIVTQCFKGTIDEINNGLIVTYPLHEQEFPLLIDRLVPRDIGLKVVRVLRCILSYCSRTQYRTGVKYALRSPSWKTKLEMLASIKFDRIDDYVKCSRPEAFKVFAFQLGQVLALIDGIELYTKMQVSGRYPYLHPYLYRQYAPHSYLVQMIERFIGQLQSLEFEQDGDQVELPYGVYNLKTEARVDSGQFSQAI